MNTDSMTIEMTDEEEAEFNAAVADPATISSDMQAREVIACLDDDLAQIRAQLDAAKIEADVCGGLPDFRQAWVRRASNALVWKIKQRRGVVARLDELNPPTRQTPSDMVAQISAKADAKVTAAKLMLELEASVRERRAEKQAIKEKNISLANGRSQSQERMFIQACRAELPKEQYLRLWDRAREMFQDDLVPRNFMAPDDSPISDAS